jgi:hypothetical protein
MPISTDDCKRATKHHRAACSILPIEHEIILRDSGPLPSLAGEKLKVHLFAFLNHGMRTLIELGGHKFI